MIGPLQPQNSKFEALELLVSLAHEPMVVHVFAHRHLEPDLLFLGFGVGGVRGLGFRGRGLGIGAKGVGFGAPNLNGRGAVIGIEDARCPALADALEQALRELQRHLGRVLRK